MLSDNTLWYDLPVWIQVLALFSNVQTSDKCFAGLFEFWRSHPELTLADFELELRRAKSRYYLFAEDPETSVFNRGARGVNGQGEYTRYTMSYTSEPLSVAQKRFPPEYFDTGKNLERLASCGFVTKPQSTDLVEYVLRVLKDSKPGMGFMMANAKSGREFFEKVSEEAILELRGKGLFVQPSPLLSVDTSEWKVAGNATQAALIEWGWRKK